MFGWFKQNPAKKLQKQIDAKRAAAVQLQRDGKIREYATMMAEIEALEDQLAEMDVS
ncbi:MAG: DUF6435 family protein [Myxococcota bacterium]